MGDLLQPLHIMVLLFVAGLFLIPAILFVLSMQNALKKCDLASVTLDPVMPWLCIVPFVNLVFNFFLVLGMAKSLRNEFNRRGIFVADPTPGQSIGLAMSICACCDIVPIVNLAAWIAQLILWIAYWIKMAGYSRILDLNPPQITATETGV
jgi:hypothetical protein